MKNLLAIIVILFFGIVLFAGVYLVSAYNSFVSLNEQVNTQWAQVETQYQRRFDLVPNLVETVKGVAEQEREVFGDIADARSRYSGAQSTQQQVDAANDLETSLARLLVIVESYPELKSNESFQTLMAQLEGTENRISVERTRYNEVVQKYNTKVKSFPSNLLASLFGYEEIPYFESVEQANEAPKVDF